MADVYPQNFLTLNLKHWYLFYTIAGCYRMIVDYKHRRYPNRLKVIRQNAGYSQLHVAKLLGQRSSVSLCDWENEKIMPNSTNLIKLCILYEKTVQELYPKYYERVERYFTDI